MESYDSPPNYHAVQTVVKKDRGIPKISSANASERIPTHVQENSITN